MNRKSIQILRASKDYNPATSTEVLVDGQPFHSKLSNLIYIGDGVHLLKDLRPTSLRRRKVNMNVYFKDVIITDATGQAISQDLIVLIEGDYYSTDHFGPYLYQNSDFDYSSPSCEAIINKFQQIIANGFKIKQCWVLGWSNAIATYVPVSPAYVVGISKALTYYDPSTNSTKNDWGQIMIKCDAWDIEARNNNTVITARLTLGTSGGYISWLNDELILEEYVYGQ